MLKVAMTRETTVAIMLNNMIGTKFKVISGYAGSAPILLAIARREVDGRCGLDWTSFKTQRPDWIREGRINILLQVGPDPEPELTAKGVPEIWPHIKSDDDRQAAALMVAQQVFGRPYIAPTGTPKDRVAILRRGLPPRWTILPCATMLRRPDSPSCPRRATACRISSQNFM